MKPKLIALNLLLLAGIAAALWQIRVHSQQAQAVRQANLNVPIKSVPPPPLSPAPKPDAPPPAKYIEVAEKNLFSKDRNPAVVIDPPKIEPPPKPKPQPPLPVVYGVMGLPSGTKAIMAEKAGMPTRPVRAGDTVGEYLISKLDTRNVVFIWDGKEIPRKIEDLVDRSESLSAPAGQSSGPAVAAPRPTNTNPTANDIGAPITETERACKLNDGIAPGTVVDGYKKMVVPSPFGNLNCRWAKQ